MAELVTTGQGEVRRTADQAALRLRYTSRGKDRGGAVNALTSRIGPVEPHLTRDGVVVRSRQLSVHDVWDGKRRNGAEAGQVYQLLVTDVTVLNDLLADLIATEPTDLDGPSWDLADRSDAFREAQRAAVAMARESAQGYADALGAHLGAITRLDDTSPVQLRSAVSYSGAFARHGQAPDVAELSLEPQWVSVPAMCSITWKLLV